MNVEEDIFVEDNLSDFNEIDPLALIVKWHNEQIFYKHTVSDLLLNRNIYYKSHAEYYQVSDQDQQQAKNIRDYYKQKFVMLVLKGIPLTDFRKKLYLIVENKYRASEAEFGVLYRLPTFYDEDIFMDMLLEGAVSCDKPLAANFNESFQFVGSHDRITRGIKDTRYWFKNKNQQIATIFIEKNSHANPIVKQYLKKDSWYRFYDDSYNCDRLLGRDDNFCAIFLSKNYKISECE